jgi:hypothetical protein
VAISNHLVRPDSASHTPDSMHLRRDRRTSNTRGECDSQRAASRAARRLSNRRWRWVAASRGQRRARVRRHGPYATVQSGRPRRRDHKSLTSTAGSPDRTTAPRTTTCQITTTSRWLTVMPARPGRELNLRFTPHLAILVVQSAIVGARAPGGVWGMKRHTHLLAGLGCALVLAAVPAAASAQSCTGTKLGTYTYTHCSDGSSSTTTQLGDFGHTTYSDGTSSTRTQLGDFGHTTYSDGTTATSTQLGDFGHTTYSDGRTSTSTRIGEYVYTRFSDGTTITTWAPASTSPAPSNTTRPSAPVAVPTTSPAAPAVYVPAPVSVPVPPADQGITLNLDSGGQKYLARGTFVKLGDAPAIYWVYGAQLHAFSTWPQFLNAGGKADLSNVGSFTYIRDNGTLFGQSVQP